MCPRTRVMRRGLAFCLMVTWPCFCRRLAGFLWRSVRWLGVAVVVAVGVCVVAARSRAWSAFGGAVCMYVCMLGIAAVVAVGVCVVADWCLAWSVFGAAVCMYVCMYVQAHTHILTESSYSFKCSGTCAMLALPLFCDHT